MTEQILVFVGFSLARTIVLPRHLGPDRETPDKRIWTSKLDRRSVGKAAVLQMRWWLVWVHERRSCGSQIVYISFDSHVRPILALKVVVEDVGIVGQMHDAAMWIPGRS